MGFLIALSAIVGAGVGIANYISNERSKREIKISESKQRITSAFSGYQSSLYKANEYIRSAEDLYNQTRTEISSKYSSDLFSLLEEQYNEINNIGSIAVTRNNLSQYYIPQKMNIENNKKIFRATEPKFNSSGKSNSILDYEGTDSLFEFKNNELGIDFDHNYENHGLSTNQYSQETLDRFYNLLATGDSSLAQSLQLSGLQIGNLLDEAFYNANQTLLSGSLSLAGYTSQARQQNLQDVETVAQARSTMASSGIRQTGTANANESLAQLQADLNKTAYAVQLKNVAMQIKSQVHEIQTSAALSAYEKNASIEIAKRQAMESVTSSYSTGTNKAERELNNSAGEVENAQEHKKALLEEYDDQWYYDIEIVN